MQKDDISSQSAKIYFADQTLSMNVLGELRATAYSEKLFAERISCEELQDEELLGKKLRAKLEYCRDNAEAIAQRVGKYINEDLVIRARVLFLLEGVSHFTKGQPGLTANHYLASQKLLFDSPTPERFMQEQQQAGMNIEGAYHNLEQVAQNLYSRGYRVRLNEFVNTQVKSWLDSQDLPDITLTGTTGIRTQSGHPLGVGQLCSTTDVATLADKIKKSATEKLENMDELILLARRSLKDNKLNQQNDTTKKAFNEVITKDSDISILLAVAMNDPNFNIVFFNGVDAAAHCREFGTLDAHGLYSAPTNTVFLPSKDSQEQRNITLGHILQYTPVGAFGAIKDFSHDVYPAIKAKPIWLEELVHHSVSLLCGNKAVPFRPGDRIMMDEIRAALLKDIKAKPRGIVANKLGGYADGGITQYVRLLEMGDEHFIHVAAKEAIAEVAYYANEHGMKAAYLEAPATAEYLQKRILPLAKARCAEIGIDLAEFAANPMGRVNTNGSSFNTGKS